MPYRLRAILPGISAIQTIAAQPAFSSFTRSHDNTWKHFSFVYKGVWWRKNREVYYSWPPCRITAAVSIIWPILLFMTIASLPSLRHPQAGSKGGIPVEVEAAPGFSKEQSCPGASCKKAPRPTA
jgi:hypothetical protein